MRKYYSRIFIDGIEHFYMTEGDSMYLFHPRARFFYIEENKWTRRIIQGQIDSGEIEELSPLQVLMYEFDKCEIYKEWNNG